MAPHAEYEAYEAVEGGLMGGAKGTDDASREEKEGGRGSFLGGRRELQGSPGGPAAPTAGGPDTRTAAGSPAAGGAGNKSPTGTPEDTTGATQAVDKGE